MSKRKRIPSPFDRILPAITRTLGPRLVLIGTGVAVVFVLLTGGSYILSRASSPPKAPIHLTYKKASQPTLAKAQVLGAATTSPEASDVSPSAAATSQAAPDVGPTQSAATNVNPSGPTLKSDESRDQGEADHGQSSDSSAKASPDAAVQVGTPLGSLSLNLPLGL